jgi:hypothetical protein
MTLYFHLGQDTDFPSVDGYTPRLGFSAASGFKHNLTLGPTVDVRRQQHIRLVRVLGAVGTVLLNNTNGALPLNTPKTIGVFGNDAADLTKGQYSPATIEPNLLVHTLPVPAPTPTLFLHTAEHDGRYSDGIHNKFLPLYLIHMPS